MEQNALCVQHNLGKRTAAKAQERKLEMVVCTRVRWCLRWFCQDDATSPIFSARSNCSDLVHAQGIVVRALRRGVRVARVPVARDGRARRVGGLWRRERPRGGFISGFLAKVVGGDAAALCSRREGRDLGEGGLGALAHVAISPEHLVGSWIFEVAGTGADELDVGRLAPASSLLVPPGEHGGPSEEDETPDPVQLWPG